MKDNRIEYKENWLALLLSITPIKEKGRYYTCDAALRVLKIKE